MNSHRITIHYTWIEAMKVLWQEMWKRLVSSEDGNPDTADTISIEDGSHTALKYEWSSGVTEPTLLMVEIHGGDMPADFEAMFFQYDGMGMVVDNKIIYGQMIRSTDGTYSVEVTQEI